MERVVGQVVLAVHVQQGARPDVVALEGFEERADPDWFNEEKIKALLGAAALDAMDKKSIGIQLMRHD
jgi:hypothetical protein